MFLYASVTATKLCRSPPAGPKQERMKPLESDRKEASLRLKQFLVKTKRDWGKMMAPVNHWLQPTWSLTSLWDFSVTWADKHLIVLANLRPVFCYLHMAKAKLTE